MKLETLLKPFYTTIRIARIFRIPIELHYSFTFFVLGIGAVTFFNEGILSALGEMSYFTVIFTAVTLHELGHCFAARKCGIETEKITLTAIGGVASISLRGHMNPLDEIYVSLAGPVINAVLSVFLFLLHDLIPLKFIFQLAAANLMLLLFNLLPNYPMDGGRVYRAMITRKYGHEKGTKLAVRLSTVFMIFFLIIGIMYKVPMLVVVGLFINFAGKMELRQFKKKDSMLRSVNKYLHLHEQAKNPYDIYSIMRKLEEDNDLDLGIKCHMLGILARDFRDCPHVEDCKVECTRYSKIKMDIYLASNSYTLQLLEKLNN